MNLDKENSSPTSKRHSFSILDACMATGANVSYSYDKTWAEWNVNIKLSCIPFPERKFRYKRIDIEDSGLDTYEYLRSHIVPEILDLYVKYVPQKSIVDKPTVYRMYDDANKVVLSGDLVVGGVKND